MMRGVALPKKIDKNVFYCCAVLGWWLFADDDDGTVRASFRGVFFRQF